MKTPQEKLAALVETGIHFDLSNEEYHASGGLSSTGVRKLMNSISDWKHHQQAEFKESKSMRIGTLFHTCVLEPARFAAECAIHPPVDIGAMNWRHVAAAKMLVDGAHIEAIADKCNCKPATAEKYLAEPDVRALIEFYGEYGADFQPVDPDELDTVERMRDRLHAHPRVKSGLLTGGLSEVSFYARREDYGAPIVKCRADYLLDLGDAWLVVDLKGTGKKADLDSFQSTVMNWRYDVQAAWYSDVIELATGKPVDAVVFAAVEFDAPHHAGLHLIDDAALDCGRWGTNRRPGYHHALKNWEAYQSNPEIFDGYSDQIETLSLPGWA